MSALEKGFLLHIGLSKTGTSTIQQTLFASHPEICYFGKDTRNKIPKGCPSQDIYNFMRPLIWDISRSLDVDRYRAILREQILPEVDSGKFLVGSWEALGNSSVKKHAERINRLQSIFGFCRVMITIRNPLTQVPSEFLQNIGGHFVKQNRPWMGKLPYIDIDEWLERKISKRKSLDEALSYSRNIRASVNLLGKENVGVFVFEELINDPDRYFGAICDFIGVDVAQGLRLTRHKHLHKRITQGQVKYLQRSSNSTWNKLILKVKRPQFRRRLLAANAGDSVPARVSLPLQWEQKISDTTRAGNRWIAENYHLPLEKYDYPI